MIIDDEYVLIGSANINDRSLLGWRDSEIAVTIKDENKVESRMDGKAFPASVYAQSLRIRLLKEHLGFDDLKGEEFPEILLDPLSDNLWHFMRETAKSNSSYYREIFNCYPDDKFQKFSDIQESIKSDSEIIEKYKLYKHKIVGFIVEFPLNFLKLEELNTSFFSKENFVPIKNFFLII